MNRSTADSSHDVVRRHLVFGGVILAVTGIVSLRVFPWLAEGALFDPDSYMRLVRIEELLETGRWYDGSIPRSNAPFGETLHWTRPFDGILLALTALLRLFLPTAEALHYAGVSVAPLLLVVLCFVVSWTVTTLVGSRWQIYAMLALLGQLGVMGYALPGRSDHHMLLLVLFALAVGLLVRLLLQPSSTVVAMSAGVALGAGLWVGPEGAVLAAVAIAALGVRWVIRGMGSRDALFVTVGLAATIATALVIERPPSRILVVEHDRVSIVHLLPAVAAAFFWSVVVRFLRGARDGRPSGPGARVELDRIGRRIGVALVGGGLVLGAQALAFPTSFLGPTADVDPLLLDVWLSRVEEYGPFLRPDSGGGIGRLVAFLGLGVVALPFAVARAWRETEPGRREAWLLLASLMAVYIPLAILRVRFAAYPGVLFAITIPVILARTEPLFERLDGWIRVAGRPILGVALIAGPLFLGAALMAAGGWSAGEIREVQAEASARCRVSDVAPLLNLPRFGEAGPIVLTRIDLGPEILYRTEARVVGTPYHRNDEGILDVARFMAATDPTVARAVVDRRDVDLVLVCGSAPSLADRESGAAFRSRLLAGDPPAWLRELPLEGAPGTGFRLYEVRR